ncbi:Transcription factor bHLH30 [Linum perenne]
MQYYDNSYTSFGDFIPLGSIHHHHHHQSSSSSSSWASLPHSTSTNHHQNSLHFAYQGGGGGGDDPHHHHHHHHLSSIISDSTLSFPNYNINMREEMMDAKALAASKNHSEAERRRRHRINTHLSNLRSLLPNTTKTDKASLLAEVIQHVKDLKRQTSHLISAATAADDDDNDDETTPIPTEEDEVTVVANSIDDEGNLVIKASLCCQDRPDLIPDLISTLNSFSLRTLKAHITTLAGRVKHVIFFTSHSHHDVYYSDDNDDYDRDYHQRIKQQPHHYSINSIHEALKAVLEKGGGGRSCSGGSVKRQRTNRNNNN